MQHVILCFREFIKTESATAVQRAFRLRFNIQPPTRKNICDWNHEFEQIGCMFKGKSSGRPRVTDENVRRIQENFERSPRKSTGRVSRETGMPQPTVWHRLKKWVHLFESRCIVYWTVVTIRNTYCSEIMLGVFIQNFIECFIIIIRINNGYPLNISQGLRLALIASPNIAAPSSI